MAIHIRGTPQSNLDLIITIPEPDDISSGMRFEDIVQTLINNDSTSNTKIEAGFVIDPNSITSTELAPNSVTTINIQDGVITGDKIAPGTIENTKIAPGTIDETKLNITNTPTAGQHLTAGSSNNATWANEPINTVGAASIGLSKLNATNRPTAGQYLSAGAADNHTWLDTPATIIAVGSIDADKLAPNSISTNKMNGAVVTQNKFANKSVNADKIEDFAIGATQIDSRDVVLGPDIFGAILERHIVDNALTLAKITGAIDDRRLGTKAITRQKLNISNTALEGQVLTAGTNNNLTWVTAPAISIVDHSLYTYHFDIDNSAEAIDGLYVVVGDDNDLHLIDLALNDNDMVTTLTWNPTVTSSTSGLTVTHNSSSAYRRENQVWFLSVVSISRSTAVRTIPGVFTLTLPYDMTTTTLNNHFNHVNDNSPTSALYNTWPVFGATIEEKSTSLLLLNGAIQLKKFSSPDRWLIEVNFEATSEANAGITNAQLVISGMYLA